jgi:hypothetical protein
MMDTTRRIGAWLTALLMAVSPLACSNSDATRKAESPSKVEAVAGSDLKSITLTQAAADRIALKTEPIASDGPSGKVIPYAAVIYDTRGASWTYTSPKPLVFVRQKITVDRIIGKDAYLTEGPGAGVAIVTVGAAELYGAETGVGK